MARVVKRLVGPIAVPTSSTIMYTAPANTRGTITRIHVVSQVSALNESFTMSIGPAASGTMLFVAGVASQVPGYGGSVEAYGPYTLNPGESLYMGSSGTGQLVVTINGYEENT